MIQFCSDNRGYSGELIIEQGGKMLKRVNLATKIGGGFGLMLLLVALLSLVSWNGLRSITGGVVGYRGLARDTNLAGSLQTEMLMMRMNVKDFIITGSEEDKAHYHDYLAKMKTFLATAKDEIQAPERAEKIALVDGEIAKYEAGFSTVVQLRHERDKLVEELNTIGPMIEKSMTELLESANSNDDVELAYEAGMALRRLLLGRVYAIKFLESHEEATAERVDKEFSDLDDGSTYLLSIVFTQEHRDLIKKVIESVKRYKANFDRVKLITDESDTIIESTLNRIGPEVASAIDDVRLSVKKDQDALGPKLQKKSQDTINVILVASVIALILGIVFAVLLTRAITRPVRGVVSFVQELAGGNFTRTLEVTHQDEIGMMTLALNDMVKQLGTMIGDIGKGVGTLSGSSSELASVSDQLSSAARQTSQKSETVSVAAEEMSANINNVSAAMEQSATNTNMVAAATEEMTATVKEIAESAASARGVSEEAVQKSQSTMEKMNELGDGANRIGKVTETITEISEQTNLLALNATIEAARAGEAGKGFAVVANEIKELAKQTASATVDIKTQIENMQKTTEITVADMNEISTVIDNINQIINGIASAVEEQSVSTSEIVENVSQTSQGISEVNESVAQSTAVVADIAREIAAINSASSEVDKSSDQVQKSASELSDLALRLDEMVKRFRV